KLKSLSAHDYFDRGDARQDAGNYDAPIADYTEALRLIPDYADADFKRGLAYSRQGNNAAAAADFQKALICDPNHPESAMMREVIRRTSVPGKNVTTAASTPDVAGRPAAASPAAPTL